MLSSTFRWYRGLLNSIRWVLILKSVYQILKCDHSNGSYRVGLSVVLYFFSGLFYPVSTLLGVYLGKSLFFSSFCFAL